MYFKKFLRSNSNKIYNAIILIDEFLKEFIYNYKNSINDVINDNIINNFINIILKKIRLFNNIEHLNYLLEWIFFIDSMPRIDISNKYVKIINEFCDLILRLKNNNEIVNLIKKKILEFVHKIINFFEKKNNEFYNEIISLFFKYYINIEFEFIKLYILKLLKLLGLYYLNNIKKLNNKNEFNKNKNLCVIDKDYESFLNILLVFIFIYLINDSIKGSENYNFIKKVIKIIKIFLKKEFKKKNTNSLMLFFNKLDLFLEKNNIDLYLKNSNSIFKLFIFFSKYLENDLTNINLDNNIYVNFFSESAIIFFLKIMFKNLKNIKNNNVQYKNFFKNYFKKFPEKKNSIIKYIFNVKLIIYNNYWYNFIYILTIISDYLKPNLLINEMINKLKDTKIDSIEIKYKIIKLLILFLKFIYKKNLIINDYIFKENYFNNNTNIFISFNKFYFEYLSITLLLKQYEISYILLVNLLKKLNFEDDNKIINCTIYNLSNLINNFENILFDKINYEYAYYFDCIFIIISILPFDKKNNLNKKFNYIFVKEKLNQMQNNNIIVESKKNSNIISFINNYFNNIQLKQLFKYDLIN